MKPFSLKTLLFLCALTFFFAAPHRAAAEEVLVEAFGYYLDIPEGWKLVDAGPPALVSFAAPGGEAVFQVTVFPQDKFASASALAAFYRGQIAASGKEAPFTYQG
ncbi:MAG: hypothetical protein LBC67_03395, partial [Spirochaetales bacterium]|nr:hypothetical protein [Spirochaetales bacterium]